MVPSLSALVGPARDKIPDDKPQYDPVVTSPPTVEASRLDFGRGNSYLKIETHLYIYIYILTYQYQFLLVMTEMMTLSAV